MVTKHGIIKKTSLEEFANIRRTGIVAVGLKKGDALRWVELSGGKDEMLITTRKGQAIRFKESQVRSMGRGAAGIRAIGLKSGDEVAGFDIISEAEVGEAAKLKVLVVMANGFAKQTALKAYKVQNRGGTGIRTAKITPKTGELIASEVVSGETEILALSAKGQVIRTALSDVRTTGRDAQGVRIMRLKSGDRLAGVIVI